MASTSSRNHGIAGRMRTAANTIYSDNQSLLGDIRKAFNAMKEVAVDLEKANQFDKVKELENAVVELLATCDDCTHLSSAVQSVADVYQPPPEPSQLTDFENLFRNEVAKQKAKSSSVTQNQSLLRQFQEAVWNVHHAGQPMPGDDQDDIVMTSTDSNIRNTVCPLSGKRITDLADPVRSVDCKHIYQKTAVMDYIRRGGRGNVSCPIAGCPKFLRWDRVLCDPLLPIEIQELRDVRKQSTDTNVIEDCTELNED